MIKKISQITLGVFCILAIEVSAETLEQIYRLATENDHQFKAAQANFKVGRENLGLGRSNLLPRLNASYDMTTTEQSAIEGVEIPDLDRSTFSVSLVQPLFDLSAWYSYEQGSTAAKISAAQFKDQEQILIIRVAEAYFDVLNAVDNLETSIAEQDALAQQLEQSRKRLEVGLAAITEVHESQAAFDSATADRLISEGQLGITFDALEVITGQPFEYITPLKDNFEVKPPEPLDRNEWIEFARDNNFSLLAASLSAKSAKANANAQRAAHFPTVTGSITYSDQENDQLDFAETGPRVFKVDSDSTVFSVNVNIPLYNGGAVSSSRRQAHYQYLEAKENYSQAKRDIDQAARANHLTVITSAATVKARKQAITSSQSALDATKAGYEVGTRDLVDVLNAQRNLFRAQRDFYSALYSYILNTLELKRTAGLLSPQDIIDLNNSLAIGKKASRNLPQ